MSEDRVLELINDLQEEVTAMREDGETDLRTVLSHIDSLKTSIRGGWNDKN